VSALGAVQAQEYAAAKWGLGLRLKGTVLDAAVETAFGEGQILRTHVMRPTWHFVTPADIRWLLELTGPRVHQRMSVYNRQLELDAALLRRGTRVIERALGGGRLLTRAELRERLGRAGLDMQGQRLAHLMLYAELEAVVCSGPRRGSQFTYALLAERAPATPRLQRDEALGELCRRYFSSHGPATVRDFVWWSGLTTADAKRGLGICPARSEQADGRTYWSVGPGRAPGADPALTHILPVYDEYIVAYRDRDAVPHGPRSVDSPGASVIFQHAVVIGGQVAGTWRVTRRMRGLTVHAALLRPLTPRDRRSLGEAVERYERFVEIPVDLVVS
jgi:hypothetical protein